MRKILPLLVLLATLPLKNYAFELSPKAQISVITGAAGQDLYALFGHSAIRVSDPFYGLDTQYNYGTFDFNTPDFYMKFTRGRLPYFLSRENYQQFLQYYQAEGRSVEEQVLDLSQADKQKLFDFLEKNALTKNKYYKYDVFFDNCATKIRDVLHQTLGEKLQWKIDKNFKKQTFKQILTPYLKEAWVNYGVFLILGLQSERRATQAQNMFLPDYLSEAVGEATIVENGKARPLAKPKIQAMQMLTSLPTQSFFTPFLLLTLLAVAVTGLTFWEYKQGKRWRGIDFALFFITGAMGCFFMLMWFATDHLALHMNLNMLWAFPPHIILSFWLLKRKLSKYWRWYFEAFGIFQLFVLLDWYILPQQLHIAVIPIMLLLAVRAFRVYQAK